MITIIMILITVTVPLIIVGLTSIIADDDPCILNIGVACGVLLLILLFFIDDKPNDHKQDLKHAEIEYITLMKVVLIEEEQGVVLDDYTIKSIKEKVGSDYVDNK